MENGSCKAPSAPGTKLCILKVPDIDFETAKHFADALVDDTDPANPILLKRRKFNVDLTLVSKDPTTGDALSNMSLVDLNNLKTTKTLA